jgi:hypothetical protein
LDQFKSGGRRGFAGKAQQGLATGVGRIKAKQTGGGPKMSSFCAGGGILTANFEQRNQEANARKVDGYRKVGNTPEPRNVTELRGFLGFTNYYAIKPTRVCRVGSKVARKIEGPKRVGQKRKYPIPWRRRKTPEEEDPQAFEAIKRLLCERLVLQRVNPDKPFVILRADASRYAVGASLEQLADGLGQAPWFPG